MPGIGSYPDQIERLVDVRVPGRVHYRAAGHGGVEDRDAGRQDARVAIARLPELEDLVVWAKARPGAADGQPDPDGDTDKPQEEQPRPATHPPIMP